MVERHKQLSMVDHNRTRTTTNRIRTKLGRKLIMDDLPQITLYIGDDNDTTTTNIITMLDRLPTSLYQVKKSPTDETERRAILTEIRKCV